MSGRRMRDVVGAVMERRGIESRVVVTGLNNDYTHYVATYEEYQVRFDFLRNVCDIHLLVEEKEIKNTL
jgi:hypothetical protein